MALCVPINASVFLQMQLATPLLLVFLFSCMTLRASPQSGTTTFDYNLSDLAFYWEKRIMCLSRKEINMSL